ncbi:hypothetical protein Q9233_017118 [Columba guinea]|nr:hypothetical protein Q9233_017118 [Columba guinea]
MAAAAAAAAALSRGAVALCGLSLLRLQRGRRLREAARRLRSSRHRRAQARSRRLFVSLWLRERLGAARAPAAAPGRERRLWSKARSSAFWETVRAKAFSRGEWRENFRLGPATFDFLAGRLRAAIERRDTCMRRAVPAEVRLALTLWRLGACTEYRAVEQQFGVSRSTVCKILRDVCEAVVANLAPAFAAPPAAAGGFALPQLAGVLARLRVPIRAPAEDAASYSAGRGWHAVELQAAVDARGCFWDVEEQFCGSVAERKTRSDYQAMLATQTHNMRCLLQEVAQLRVQLISARKAASEAASQVSVEMSDWALQSAGAAVDTRRTSQTYSCEGNWICWALRLFYAFNPPETVLQAVHEIINQALEKLEEMQVPMPDYALKSAGAAVIRSRTSPPLRTGKAKVFLYSLTVMDYMRSPELILEPDNHPGNCWPFPGSQGHIFIKLSVPVVPRAITMAHVLGTAFHGESISGAPKDFAVYGFKEEHEEQGMFLGQFTFLAALNPSQTFQLKNELPGVMN